MKVVITVESDKGKKRRFEFEENDMFIFGRASDAHCQISNDKYVSRYHFLLEINPPAVTFCDLGSLNATYLNGKKHGGREEDEKPDPERKRHQPAPLKNRDVLRVGQTELRVAIEGVVERKGGNGDLPYGDATAAAIIECLLQKMITKAEKGQPLPTIGGFEVQRKIGEGGFGAVYLARDLKTGDVVALKTMLQTQTPSERQIHQFEREIETCRTLKHPHIVTMQRHGVEDNIWYFAMEYMDGGSVWDLMKASGKKLDLPLAIALMTQALEGLAHAHAKGYIHRDLKPPNLLLKENRGTWLLKVSDFGLAKSFAKAGATKGDITLRGGYVGSPFYLAPEQITNYRWVKPPTDVFEIAASFYHAITGHPVWTIRKGEDPLRAILEGTITPILQREPNIPPGLAAVFERALARDPKERFPNAGEMLAAVKAATGG